MRQTACGSGTEIEIVPKMFYRLDFRTDCSIDCCFFSFTEDFPIEFGSCNIGVGKDSHEHHIVADRMEHYVKTERWMLTIPYCTAHVSRQVEARRNEPNEGDGGIRG